MDTPKGRFMSQINSSLVSRLRQKSPHYYSCDPTAVAVVIDETAILEQKNCYCQVELHGTTTRGQVVVDWDARTKHAPNVNVVTKVDPQKVMNLFENMMK